MHNLSISLTLIAQLILVDGSQALNRPPQSDYQNDNPLSLISQNATFPTEPTSLTEEFSFSIKDFKIDHQREINNLNLGVTYRYASKLPATKYPDFRLVAKDIEMLLSHYPNKTDYWEIMNLKLTSMVLRNYPAIARITVRIDVSPSTTDPYARSSIVTRSRANSTGHSGRIAKKTHSN